MVFVFVDSFSNFTYSTYENNLQMLHFSIGITDVILWSSGEGVRLVQPVCQK